MRTRIFLIALLFALPAHALETKPVELAVGPGAQHAVLPTGPVSITLDDEEGATISFRLPSGKEQREENIGQEFAVFKIKDRNAVSVEAQDIDGDGLPEVIARTIVPGGDGALYVYRFDAAKGRFAPAEMEDGEDFLYVHPKSQVTVAEDGAILVTNGRKSDTYAMKAGRLGRKTASATILPSIIR